jgi:hypothetical protein
MWDGQSMRLPYSWLAAEFCIAFGQFDFAILTAELFHLLDSRVRLQLSLGALLQFAVNSLVIGIPVADQTLS